MAVGSEENSPPIKTLRPHIELFRSGSRMDVEVPLKFQEQSRAIFGNTYPQESIKRMQQDGYNPTLIGYDHSSDNSDLPSVKRRLTALKESNPDKSLKIAHEIIPPLQLQHIKDFLQVSQEYKTKGTIFGKIPDRPPGDPQAYRGRLNANHAENLALWMLEQGFNVVPLDSPDVEQWIKQDNGITYGDSRQALTAIKRDAYGLEVMDRERPDIITTGNAHAIKYDILLDRDGSRSYYYMERLGDWNDILDLWQQAHKPKTYPSQQSSMRSRYSSDLEEDY